MNTPSQIIREIMRVEAEIDSPAGRGRLTILKAYHRKLCAQYRKAAMGQRKEA